MANYYGAERTNYVRIREDKLEEVRAYKNLFGMEVINLGDRLGFIPSNFSDDGCFPSCVENEAGAEVELDWKKIATCMEVGQVLVVMHVGREKLRYLNGSATAWDWRGEFVEISLKEIYERAAEKFGVAADDITDAAY